MLSVPRECTLALFTHWPFPGDVPDHPVPLPDLSYTSAEFDLLCDFQIRIGEQFQCDVSLFVSLVKFFEKTGVWPLLQ